jgi:hypothetical protein
VNPRPGISNFNPHESGLTKTGIENLHDNRQEYTDQHEFASDGRSQLYSNTRDFNAQNHFYQDENSLFSQGGQEKNALIIGEQSVGRVHPKTSAAVG